MKEYVLVPAYIENGQIKPFEELGIKKTELEVKEAWTIGLNDPDMSAIKPDDKPIIPKDKEEIPVLEVIEFQKKNSPNA